MCGVLPVPVRLLSIITFLFIGDSALAQRLCASNVREFNAQRSQMHQAGLIPEFQQLPVILVRDRSGMILGRAALRIRPVEDGRLKLEGVMVKLGSLVVDDVYIRNICFEDGRFSLNLENGKTPEAVIESGRITISNFNFEIGTEAQYQAMVRRLNPAAPSTPRPSAK